MATTISSTVLSEKGAGVIQVSFKDEDNAAVVPNPSTIKWTLTNNPPSGTTATVINSREQVDITSGSTVNILLEGDDLALLSDETNDPYAQRVLTVEWQYDSTIASNIDDKAQHVFKIENLKYIT